MGAKLDIPAGMVFGSLVVLNEVIGSKIRKFKLRCVCGKECVSSLTTLRYKGRDSCGCLGRLRTIAAVVFAKRTHGLKKSCEYRTWNSLKDRCLNKNNIRYARYGGRGIAVDVRWLKFENFFADMGIRPVGMSIERLDNNGPYNKDNCVWASAKEQANNRGTSRLLTFMGKRMTVTQAAEKIGINASTLFSRIASGKPEDDWFRPLQRIRNKPTKLTI